MIPLVINMFEFTEFGIFLGVVGILAALGFIVWGISKFVEWVAGND